jgi:hypothetical protein
MYGLLNIVRHSIVLRFGKTGSADSGPTAALIPAEGTPGVMFPEAALHDVKTPWSRIRVLDVRA